MTVSIMGRSSGDRHAVIQEAWILQLAVGVVDVFLVQRPADALHRTTLILALDVIWMDRLAGVLYGQITQHRGLAGFGIDFDIGNMDTKAGTRTFGIDLGVPAIGPPVLAAMAATSAKDIGLLSPALGPDGRTCPSSQTTGVGLDSPDLGGPVFHNLIILRDASMVAMPPNGSRGCRRSCR